MTRGPQLLKVYLRENSMSLRQAEKVIGFRAASINLWKLEQAVPKLFAAMLMDHHFGIPVKSWLSRSQRAALIPR